MPWCEDCERFANPNSLGEDGSCPTCGRVIAEVPEPPSADAAGVGGEDGDRAPVPGEEAPPPVASTKELRRAAFGVSTGDGVPWHFWVLLVAVVAYLGWRLIQGVIWLIGQF